MSATSPSSRSATIDIARRRLRQGLVALAPRVPADRDAILARTLTATQARAFRGLPAHDQAHLCRVYRLLRSAGVEDGDLLAAALLHDLGKVAPGARVRLPDRIAKVLLRRLAPGLLRHMARQPAPPWRRGLALAVHHPALGAARAAELGCSPRVCWLITHHEDTGALGDPDLARLAAADRAG